MLRVLDVLFCGYQRTLSVGDGLSLRDYKTRRSRSEFVGSLFLQLISMAATSVLCSSTECSACLSKTRSFKQATFLATVIEY